MDFLAAVTREASVVPTELHEVAAWTPAGGAVSYPPGIYQHVSEVTDIGAYIEADGIAATFNVATASVPAVALGDAMTVRDQDYRVVGVEPTGRGRTVLVLGL